MTSSGRILWFHPPSREYPTGRTVTRSSSLPCVRDDRPRPGPALPAQCRPEGRPAGGRRPVAHGRIRRPAGAGDPHVRRARWCPWDVVVRTGIGLVPVRRRPRRDLGSATRRGGWSRARAGGALQERQHRARPDGEPAPHPGRRAQLRVLQRGSGPDGGARRRLRQRAAVRACGRVHQALRRQRHGVRADDDLLGGRRTHAARAVPRPVRGRRPPGRRARGHVRLQPPQRHVLQRAPLAADRAASRRVGLRRPRRQRLVRHAQRGRVAARRARCGDARPATSARRAPARRAASVAT